MGTWSTDILGSDQALDVLANMEDLLGFSEKEEISLYPLPKDKETIVIVESALSKNEKRILAYKWDQEDWPVVAAVYLATGTKMPSEVIAKSMHSCFEEIKSLKKNDIGWDNPQERKQVLSRFVELIDWHEPGKITNIEHVGLFQKIAEL